MRFAFLILAHTAPEQLDHLRTFATADIHQAHATDPPAAPALGELAGTDQQVDGRSLLVDVLEQGTGEVALDARYAVFLAQIKELLLVTDVDHTEVVRIAYPQTQFPISSF